MSLIQSTLQSGLPIAMSDPPNSLGGEMNNTSHHGCGLARRQLLQGNGPEHHPNLLNPGPKNLADCFLIFPGHLKFDGAS